MLYPLEVRTVWKGTLGEKINMFKLLSLWHYTDQCICSAFVGWMRRNSLRNRFGQRIWAYLDFAKFWEKFLWATYKNWWRHWHCHTLQFSCGNIMVMWCVDGINKIPFVHNHFPITIHLSVKLTRMPPCLSHSDIKRAASIDLHVYYFLAWDQSMAGNPFLTCGAYRVNHFIMLILLVYT